MTWLRYTPETLAAVVIPVHLRENAFHYIRRAIAFEDDSETYYVSSAVRDLVRAAFIQLSANPDAAAKGRAALADIGYGDYGAARAIRMARRAIRMAMPDCYRCGAELDDDRHYDDDGHVYCDDCFSELFFCCDGCSATVSTDDGHSPENGGGVYCESCYDERYFHCADCGDETDSDHGVNVNESQYCRECASESYFCCESCGEWTERDEENYDEDAGASYCNSCARDREPRVINPYSFRPRPTFFKGENEPRTPYNRSRLFLGIELEVECRDDRRGDLAQSVVDGCNGLVYCKEDGSLDTGFEIVTHPFSALWYAEHRDAFEPIFHLRKRGARSHNTTTCGMHVHLSKDAFSELHLYKFISLIYNRPQATLAISQREESNLERWAALHYGAYDSIASVAKKKEQSCGRYVAVNLTPKTAEVRIFRGNLRPERFHKNIEFCLAAFEFSRVESIAAMRWRAFREWTDAQRKRFPNLAAFLHNAPQYSAVND